MNHFTLSLAALLCSAAGLTAQAQNPFEQQTKAVYVYNVEHGKFLSDYQSPTPHTYCLQEYGPSRAEAILFELTTINAATGESVLYTPWTDCYMSVPAAGGFVNATEDVARRTVLTVKPTDDGHNIIYSGTTLLSPYKNGAFMLLVGYTEAHQAAGWGNVEECRWDFVEPEDLDDFLIAHGIDPEYDPYDQPIDPVDPDIDPDEPIEEKATFEDLQYALIEARQALLAVQGGIVAQGDGLITSAEQFYSLYSDAEEGTDFDCLIDANSYTFWHSDWHGDAPEGPHSIDVLLPETASGTLFVADYCGRTSGNNCSPVEMSLYGGHRTADAELPYAIDDAPFTALTRFEGLGAYAGWGHSANAEVLTGSFAFEADDFYDALRFEPTLVVSDAGEGAQPCFNYSEFQLFAAQRVAPTAQAQADDIDELANLVEAALGMTRDEDPTDLLAELTAATARVAGTEGITTVAAPIAPDARLYDIHGRRISQPTAGISIRAGRKVIK